MNVVQKINQYKVNKEEKDYKKHLNDKKTEKINIFLQKILKSEEQIWYIYSDSTFEWIVANDFSFKIKILDKRKKYELEIEVLNIFDSFGELVTDRTPVKEELFYGDSIQIKLAIQRMLKRPLMIRTEELIGKLMTDSEETFYLAKKNTWNARKKYEDNEKAKKLEIENNRKRLERDAENIKSYREQARKRILWKRYWFINDTTYNPQGMSGIQFEKFVGKLYEMQGFDVFFTPITGDFGVDIVLNSTKLQFSKIAVQVKNYSYPVGVEAVQQVYSGMKYYDCHSSMVVTNSTFTNQAIEFSKKLGVQLVDGSVVKKLYIEYEEIIPDFDETQFNILENKGAIRGYVSETEIDLFISKPFLF